MKLAKIVTLLKAYKSPTAPSSYRPNTFLSTPSKILEKLIVENITPHIILSLTPTFRLNYFTNSPLTQ